MTLPKTLRMVGDGQSPGSCRLVDAATGEPVLLPITKIESIVEMCEPNRIIVTLSANLDVTGTPDWRIGEEDLRQLAEANGFIISPKV